VKKTGFSWFKPKAAAAPAPSAKIKTPVSSNGRFGARY
jgi:hypothetical protein